MGDIHGQQKRDYPILGILAGQNIVPGESVLIEYDSLVFPYKGFYHLLSWARENNYHLIIIDILDTLYLYKAQIALAGLDTGAIDSAEVIKIGGQLNVGKIIDRLPASDIPRLIKDFERIYSPHLLRVRKDKE